jgi:hypothetical protein
MSHGPTLVMFDPMVVWRDLLPEERDRIGAAALAYGAASNVVNYVDEATGHDENALEVAAMALEEAVEDAAFFQGDARTVYVPDLNGIGIAQCRSCRCTRDHACDGGCHWVSPGLCSTCATSPDQRGVGMIGSILPALRRHLLIPRNPIFNVYLHHFLRSDDDRALHDHPWINLSLLLDGCYLEHCGDGRARFRDEGQFVARRAARDARCAARRASADYVDPDPNGIPDLRGGWGDSYEASLLGSRLWQLNRSKITDATTPLPARLAPLARFHEQRRIDGRQGVRVMPGVTDPFAETNRRVSLIDARRSAVIAEAERMVYEGMSEGRWRRLCSAVLGLRELSIKPGPTTPPHANSNFEGGTKA